MDVFTPTPVTYPVKVSGKEERDNSLYANYQLLGCAIAAQASEDYRWAIKYMYKTFSKIVMNEEDCDTRDLWSIWKAEKNSKNYRNAVKYIVECEIFFDDCVMTNKYAKGEIAKMLREQAKDELRNPGKRKYGRYESYMEDMMLKCVRDSYLES